MNFSNTEESFVLSSLKEFVKAWGSGNHAYFNLECKNGSAFIQLSFNLGHPGETHHHHGPPQPYFQTQSQKKNYGPSSTRRKRNNERARAHQAKLAAASATLLTPELPSPPTTATSAASDSTSSPRSPAPPVNSIAADPAVSSASSPASIECSSPPVVPTACVEEVIPPPVLDEPGTAVQDDQGKDDATAINICGTDSVPVCPPSVVVPVFAIAAFENCPDEFLRDEYLDSLRKFLASENHLAQNVTLAECSPPSRRCFRQGVFTHTMHVVLHVKVDRLWESPASYIRKHLGCPNNEWSKQNGTVVKLSRIHQ